LNEKALHLTKNQYYQYMTTNKISGASMNINEANREKLKTLFPSVFTETVNEEGVVVESIDFERLKAELGTFTDLFEARKERYGFDWPGKKDSLKAIQSPTYATLKPCPEDSVNFETTENLFIEGDNLEVLKLLQKSYYGEVKMIYIDPPYNTGKDFIYPDNYSESLETYLAYAGMLTDDGKRIEARVNSRDDGRFHSKWVNMLYPRLYLARNLLAEDGVIFVSISDDEVVNARSLLNEIFGEDNFVSCLIWNKQHSQQQGIFKTYHEYILLYAKNKDAIDNISGGDGFIDAGALKKISRANPASEFTFPAGVRFEAKDGVVLSGTFGDAEKVTVINGIFEAESGKTKYPITLSAGWTQKDQMTQYFKGEPVLDTKGQTVLEFYFNSAGKLKCRKQRSKITPSTFLPEYGMVSEQTAYLESIFGKPVFDNPKPVQMIRDFISWFVSDGDIVLDFYAGSGTTGEALILEKGVNAKFILVQLPEKVEGESESGKNAISLGYSFVSEISRDRIKKICEKHFQNVDGIGFKTFKLDKSNFKRWQKILPDTSAEKVIEQLELHIEHIEHGAKQSDLLYEVLIKAGYKPTAKVESSNIAGGTIYTVEDGEMLICLDENISKELVDAVIELSPPQFVCLDSAFSGNDQLKANAVQTFSAANQDREKKNQILFRTI
jgi:adenine-specific DNA-methyltransferase